MLKIKKQSPLSHLLKYYKTLDEAVASLTCIHMQDFPAVSSKFDILVLYSPNKRINNLIMRLY